MTKATVQFKLQSIEDLAKAINGIKTRGAKFDMDVQKAAVQCIAYSIKDRNVTPCNDLYDALPKGSRRDSLVSYFERFGNCAWMKDDKKIKFFDAKLDWTPAYALEASAFMWTGAKKQAEIVSKYDVETEASKFFDRLEKILKDSTKTVQHRELYDELRKTYASYVMRGVIPVEEVVEPTEIQLAA
jgi:hypothetical protein